VLGPVRAGLLVPKGNTDPARGINRCTLRNVPNEHAWHLHSADRYTRRNEAGEVFAHKAH